MAVRLTRTAVTDLVDISAYVAAENPDAARRLIDLLKRRARELGEIPEGFAVIADVGGRRIRRRPVGPYLLLYEVVGADVVVLRIVHARRDVDRLLADLPGAP